MTCDHEESPDSEDENLIGCGTCHAVWSDDPEAVPNGVDAFWPASYLCLGFNRMGYSLGKRWEGLRDIKMSPKFHDLSIS